MTNVRFWLLCSLLIAIIPVAYFLNHWTDSQFLDNAMGNWFATMVGVAVGIPIALEINRRQQAAQENKEREVQEQEETVHKAKILKLVGKELEYNRVALLARQPNKESEAQRKVSVNRLKDELWNAFSDGGELQWVKDLELLDYVSTAYYHIRTIIYLEERYFEATHFPGLQARQEKYPKDYILEYLTQTDSAVIASIEKALEEIGRSLTAVPSAAKD
jgi:hypothetical protein